MIIPVDRLANTWWLIHILNILPKSPMITIHFKQSTGSSKYTKKTPEVMHKSKIATQAHCYQDQKS